MVIIYIYKKNEVRNDDFFFQTKKVKIFFHAKIGHKKSDDSKWSENSFLCWVPSP
jgi:hypothetical protein